MTTLSKEDIVRMDSESGLYVYHNGDADIEQLQAFATLARADLVAENERLTDSNQMYLDRIEYLERKYRCHNEYAKRPILYTDGVDGEQCCRDDLWAVSTAELSAMTDQLTAARTALAAAEAREGKLLGELENIKVFVQDINGGRWLYERVLSCLMQPRDNSALRDMIAEVYEECALFIEPQRNDLPATGIEFSAALRSWAEVRLQVLAEKLS